MKITAQDFHALYSPSKCGLRVYLRANNEPEAEPSEFEEVLLRLGQRHEASHLATFPQVVNLSQMSIEVRAQETLNQVANQTAVLYQPVFRFTSVLDDVTCEFVTAPDFLIREGDGYVIRDVKMVRRVDEENHPEVIFQLQLYGWLFEQIFGRPPVRIEVFNGQSEIVNIVYDGGAAMLRELEKVIQLKGLTHEPYEPVGWSKCTGCGFHERCWTNAKAKNDVALVLGVDQGLAVELHRQGVKSIQELVSRFNEATLERFKRPWGKKMQRVGKAAGSILRSAQALLTNKETVLTRPAIQEHDHYVMFDLEGMPPQLDEMGKIYLWGMQVFGQTQGEFMPATAGFGTDGDRAGWHQFLHNAATVFNDYGDIFFAHWHHYEKTHVKEYIERYGDPQGVAARVLENLLDLLPIARDSVVLPLYSYSLKEVEKYVGFKRSQTEYGGAWSMAKYIEATETKDEALRKQVMNQIIQYNKEDLAATWKVFQWLKGKLR